MQRVVVAGGGDGAQARVRRARCAGAAPERGPWLRTAWLRTAWLALAKAQGVRMPSPRKTIVRENMGAQDAV